jgi:DNA helicase-2/ATP-dependent DNA helicase PcrA
MSFGAYFLRVVSNFKVGFVTPDEAAVLYRSDSALPDAAEDKRRAFEAYLVDIYKRVEEWKMSEGIVTFDDMLDLWYRLMQDDNHILQTLRQKWNYVIVDETQDNNFGQFKLAQMIAEDHGNIFVVGDDDQCIYSFRGVDPESFVNFTDDWPDATVIKLSTNYRCPVDVVSTASGVVEGNSVRVAKAIIANAPAEPGTMVAMAEVSVPGEAKAVAAEVDSLLQSGVKADDIALIYRKNSTAMPFEYELLMHNIPYKISNGSPFYERAVVKDALAFLVLAAGTFPHNIKNAALERVYNKPTRYLGKTFWNMVKGDPLTLIQDSTRFSGRMADNVSNLNNMLIEIQQVFKEEMEGDGSAKQRLSAAFLRVLTESGYLNFTRERIESTSADEDTQDEISMLVSLCSAYFSSAEEVVQFFVDRKKQDQSKQGTVVLTTVHRAKGLEWPYVFNVNFASMMDHMDLVGGPTALADMANNAADLAYLEEERRVLYVAMTRAQKKLYISIQSNWGATQDDGVYMTLPVANRWANGSVKESVLIDAGITE